MQIDEKLIRKASQRPQGFWLDERDPEFHKVKELCLNQVRLGYIRQGRKDGPRIQYLYGSKP